MTQAAVPEPSIRLTSFACPVCGAHATQTWFLLHLGACHPRPTPPILSNEEIARLDAQLQHHVDAKARAPIEKALAHARHLIEGEPFSSDGIDTIYGARQLFNVFVSQCYTCRKLSIWLHDRLLYPPVMTAPPPNPDLSIAVQADYEEARKILDLSPRGAAALLRLSIQKICAELNAVGNNLNEQIAYLVSKGLPEEVRQALDAVRVIGNEAVHPGELDLRDDRDTVGKLFSLVNFIADDRITRPKRTQELYSMISSEKRDAINKRDKR